MPEVRRGPDGGFASAFCQFCGLASQVREVHGDFRSAMDAAIDANDAHERTHPEWTPPKPLMDTIKEIRASVVAAELAHHTEHGCTYGKCVCRCGCASQTDCSKNPSLCLMCALYEGRGHEEHGEGPGPAPVLTRAEIEARLTDKVLDDALLAMSSEHDASGSAWALSPIRDVLLAALFPKGGQ